MATNWIDGETEVTAANLIKDQTAVQVTQPTGGQGVWIKDSKNLFDGITESGAYNSSGVKTTDNTMTRTANKIPVKPNVSYIWSNNGAGVPMNVFEYDRNGAFISSQTGITANSSFTTTSTTYFITAYKGNANTDKLQLEYGSTIHVYENYIENPTINTNINGQYKEIYNKDNMGDLIVDSVAGKNLYNSEFRQGSWFDTTNATRIYSSQKLYLKAGTYTVSTNLNFTTFDYAIDLATFTSPAGAGHSPDIYDSGWVSTSSHTFTVSQSGYFYIGVRKKDNSSINPSSITGVYFQLEKGSQATSYQDFNTTQMGSIVVDDILPENLIPFEAVTTTSNGVTFTANADKTVKINGTATAQTDFTIGNVSLKAGQQYYLSGAKGGSANTWFLNIQGVGNDNGSGFIYTPAQDETKRIFIRVKNGVTVNNAICTPKLNKGLSLNPFDNSESEVYSTNEIKIGTWIDGKPLYRKVLQITMPSNGNYYEISLGISNIDTIMLNGNSHILHSTNYKLPLNAGYGNASFSCWACPLTTGKLAISSTGADIRGENAIIIVEYTKTTD